MRVKSEYANSEDDEEEDDVRENDKSKTGKNCSLFYVENWN